MVKNLENYVSSASIFKYWYCQHYVYIQILVLSTFQTNQGVTTLSTHPPQKYHVNVIHDTVMLHQKNRANVSFILP